MDFFHRQETLSLIEWMLRAAVTFFFLVAVAKALGQRAISQLRVIDFAIVLVIGNIVAHPLSDEGLGLKGSFVTTLVMLFFYLASVFMILKWPWFRKLVSHAPITVVQNGEILYAGLKKARISLDVLLEELREKKVDDINKVALAIWEADGKISFFLDPKYEPLTPGSLQMKTEPFDLPRTIVKEGKINTEELKHLSKDESWVASQLAASFQTDIKNVLLATLDTKDNLKVFLYK
ncbi:DUF421 domain-containing protein [Domibacillus robiginosus]|uniref:DUF421 domain-containing protein n=1 Tax=Domibacillus robiginosus TaxID=1071054 RepID=UPI00067E522A|nr:DUF421 domain-containing protein [Domibacillus robiginosus]